MGAESRFANVSELGEVVANQRLEMRDDSLKTMIAGSAKPPLVVVPLVSRATQFTSRSRHGQN